MTSSGMGPSARGVVTGVWLGVVVGVVERLEPRLLEPLAARLACPICTTRMDLYVRERWQCEACGQPVTTTANLL